MPTRRCCSTPTASSIGAATLDAQIDDIERQLGSTCSSGLGFDLGALEQLAGQTDGTVVLHAALSPSHVASAIDLD